MNFLKKTVGFMAVFCAIPAAFALTARPSVIGTASSRLPTMTAYINAVSGATSSSSTSNLLDNVECIDAYTSCLKGADVCGANFEECTNKVLFHAKMPMCLSTLAQCTASGVNALFGTSSTTALANVASRNEHDEVTDYTYPTDGSVLGQMITGAAISNMYDTSDCVRRYTSCLQRDNVCGAEFELCTTNTEFRKQMVLCGSTLARCQSDGKIELFGSTSTTANPASDSRVGILIAEGAALAAVNAVSTCYKVVDQCILNACAANPYKCIADSSEQAVKLVDAINAGVLADTTTSVLMSVSETVSNSSVRSYIRNSCLDTIGGNKYCYATFLGNGMMPSSSQLSDADNQEDVFAEAYSSRMNDSMRARLNDLIEDFDTDAKEKCSETLSSCVMRVCGGGNGAACYSLVYGSNDKSINNDAVYDEIKTGCSAIVNTDPYCQYAAQNPTSTGTYTYTYNQADAFTTLFPEYDDNGTDPIGVIASLNASLATSYSDAAIAQMRTQCENVAKSCVKSMCGDEYTNCYRNRTDIYSSLTNTGTSSFDKSMNKVGGVLDYTIVLGLCLDTVKGASVCQEHLAIETAKMKLNNSQTSAWGDSSITSVRSGWLDAGRATELSGVEGDVQATDADGNLMCTASDGTQGICNTVGTGGVIYDTPIYVSYSTYAQNQAAETMFRSLVYDIEKEAQAIYNSKLTQEQNMCLASNAGGIIARNDTGSTFMWSKLRNNRKVPDDYTVMGLERNDFVASNDLYGSFCTVKITIQSDDPDIRNAMNGADWATTYFAVGDTFTCGSWIPSNDLETIANTVADEQTADKAASQRRTRTWLGVLGGVAGAIGGAYLGQGINDGSILGGLTGKKDSSNTKTSALARINAIERIISNPTVYGNEIASVTSYMSSLENEAKSLGVIDATITGAKTAVSKWSTEYDNTHDANGNIKKEDGKNVDTAAYDNAVTTATTQLNALKIAINNTDGKSDSDNKNSWIAPTVGAVVTGAAGATILTLATRDIQNANLSAEQKQIYEDWMNNVGSHLKCYIGADEAGEYGDIISVSME